MRLFPAFLGKPVEKTSKSSNLNPKNRTLNPDLKSIFKALGLVLRDVAFQTSEPWDNIGALIIADTILGVPYHN